MSSAITAECGAICLILIWVNSKFHIATGRTGHRTAGVDLAEGVEVAPAFDEGIDVLVVDIEGFGLDERVLVLPVLDANSTDSELGGGATYRLTKSAFT